MNWGVQIKLLPTQEQSKCLLNTMARFNEAATWVANNVKRMEKPRHYTIQTKCYYDIKTAFSLSGHVACLVCARVSGAFESRWKNPRFVVPKFRPKSAMLYDLHTVSLNLTESTASLWALPKRIRGIPFVCSEKQRALLNETRKQTQLIYKRGMFFLNITLEIPDTSIIQASDVLGVDLGISNIAFDSDSNQYSGAQVISSRNRRLALRNRLQSKGTKSAKKLLRKRSGKLTRFVTNTNHIISKRIVSLAERTGRAVALESLWNVQDRIRVPQSQRHALHSWAFGQLRSFIEYKAEHAGVPVFFIDPAHTSQRCNACGHTAKNNRRRTDVFICRKCGHTDHADGNGAKNIRLKGLNALARLQSSSHTQRPLAMPINIAVPSCKPASIAC